MTSVGRFLFSNLVLPAIAVQAKETDIEENHRDVQQTHTALPVDKLGLGTTGQGVDPAPAFASRRNLSPRLFSRGGGGDDESLFEDFLTFRQWQQSQMGGAYGRQLTGTSPSPSGLRQRRPSGSRSPLPHAFSANQPAIFVINAGPNTNMRPSNLQPTNEPGVPSDPVSPMQIIGPSGHTLAGPLQQIVTADGAVLPRIGEEDRRLEEMEEAKQGKDIGGGGGYSSPVSIGAVKEAERPPTPHSCNTVEHTVVEPTLVDGEVVDKAVTRQTTYSQDELYTAATQFYHRLLAEALGTWAVTFFIAGLNIERNLGHIDQIGVALGSGLVFVSLIYSLGQVSGAHFNPVVTFAFVLRGMFPLTWLPFYWIVQFVGAIVAAAMLLGFYGTTLGDAGATLVPDAYSQQAGFFMETVLVFVLVFTILSMASRSKIVGPHAALAIGSVIAFNIMLAGSYSGASMNPWRSVCVSLVFPVSFYSIWVYFAGPFFGSFIAVLVVFMLAGKPRNEELSAGIGATIAVAVGNAISRDDEAETVK